MKSVNLLGMMSDPGKGKSKGTVDAVPALTNEFAKYIQSPLYKQRLKKMGVSNPDMVIGQRLDNLKRIQLSTGTPGLMYGFTAPGQKVKTPMLSVKPDSTRYEAIHEISHVTNHGEPFFRKNMATKDTASGQSMSFSEMMFMLSRQKNKKMVLEGYNKALSNLKAGYFASPTEGISGVDPHGFDISEVKSDIDAFRLLLKDRGVTKQFGEDITPEVIKKAKEDKTISGDHHFQRLLKTYSEKDLIDVHNSIAMTNSGGSNVA